MIKKFCNLIDQDHFGDVNKVFVCKINENFIFETISMSLHCSDYPNTLLESFTNFGAAGQS